MQAQGEQQQPPHLPDNSKPAALAKKEVKFEEKKLIEQFIEHGSRDRARDLTGKHLVYDN